MGWDSDSDDGADIAAQLAAKNAAAKKKYVVGLCRFILCFSQFEDEERALEAAAKAKLAVNKPSKSAPVVSGGTVEIVTTRTYDEDEIALSDPSLEKKRMQRLQEKAEMSLMDDLFSGCDKPATSAVESGGSTVVREVVKTIREDTFEKLVLVTTRDVEALAVRCADKITSSDVKSAGHKFVHELFRSIGHVLSVSEVAALSKTLKDLSTAKQREAAEKLAGKKKLPTDVAQMKKGAKIDVHDAMSELYGDYGDYEEDY